MSKDWVVAGCRLLVVLVFGFIIRPLGVLSGINIILSSIAVVTIPYSLSVYFGVMLVMCGFKAELTGKE